MKITRAINNRLAEAHRSGKDDQVALLKSLRDEVAGIEAAEQKKPTPAAETERDDMTEMLAFFGFVVCVVLMVVGLFAIVFR